ncbi:MAG: DUF4034 domain-containing protein [Burkholderiales bacterium]|nr:DUF4034 domain-containing protein [Burkholderiales bacterium]
MVLNKTSLLLCLALMAALPAIGAPVPAQAAAEAKPAAPTVPEMVAAAFRFGDFPELERLYAIYGQPGLRSPLTGNPRIEHFWMGVSQISNSNLRVTEDYYTQIDAMTQKWALDHPESVLAQLLYAESLTTHAWFHRGGGYANTVSPASWAGFRKYLNLANDQLRRSQKLAVKDSSWNQIMMTVGQGLNWNVNQFLAVLEDGLAKNPDHDNLYFQMETMLLPKWGGDIETCERFIESVTERTREKRGMEMYARLYAGLSYAQLEQSLFSDTRASWPKMKAGFEDRLSRYPHVDHRNMYAYFACMAKDRQALQEQLQKIGDAFDPSFWGHNPERTFEECKAMARQL